MYYTMCSVGVGCWLLVVGCWLLVVGCWLLVIVGVYCNVMIDVGKRNMRREEEDSYGSSRCSKEVNNKSRHRERRWLLIQYQQSPHSHLIIIYTIYILRIYVSY